MLILRSWFLERLLPPQELEKSEPSIRIQKKSLLKSGFRGFFMNDIDEVKKSQWFSLYLSGERVEFYVEGSGTYFIANMDVVSREIYFARSDGLPSFPPFIFYCYQTDYERSMTMIENVLREIVSDINKRAYPIGEIEIKKAYEEGEGAVKIDSNLIRKIRESLIFVADVSPVMKIDGKNKAYPNPNVCIEVGYALKSKRADQVKLIQISRKDMGNLKFPFDIDTNGRITANDPDSLRGKLDGELRETLRRYRVI